MTKSTYKGKYTLVKIISRDPTIQNEIDRHVREYGCYSTSLNHMYANFNLQFFNYIAPYIIGFDYLETGNTKLMRIPKESHTMAFKIGVDYGSFICKIPKSNSEKPEKMCVINIQDRFIGVNIE